MTSIISLEAINNTSYSYLVGVDAPNIQLLCTSDNTLLSLSNITWISNGEVRDNPLTIGMLVQGNNSITCTGNNSELLTSRVAIQGKMP